MISDRDSEFRNDFMQIVILAVPVSLKIETNLKFSLYAFKNRLFRKKYWKEKHREINFNFEVETKYFQLILP